MSVLDHAQNTLVQGNMTATQDNRITYNAEVTKVAGTQNVYHGASVKGAFVESAFISLI